MKGIFQSKVPHQTENDKCSLLLIPSRMAGKEEGDNFFTLHLLIHTFRHACIHSFNIILGACRHCPRHRNTKVKMVPITEFTVCQGRQMCKQTILASIPLQHRVQNTKMAQTSYTLEVRKQFFGGVYIWARLWSMNRYSSGEWGVEKRENLR